MAKIITLRYPSECKECGTPLPAGTKARWYRRHGVYGLDCHQKQAVASQPSQPSQEDYPCTDLGYEDQCAAACGLTGVDHG